MENIKLMDEKELKDWYFNDKEQPTIKDLILELYVWGNKINDIIDWVNEPDDVEDRLKTLEDKVKFIMKYGHRHNFKMDGGKLIEPLQDLWDEENEEHLEKEVIKEFIKPDKCNDGITLGCKCDDDFCSCPITELYNDGKIRITKKEPTDNSEKIEEIISLVLDCVPVDNEAEMGGVINFASWGVKDKESAFAMGFRKGYEMHTEETKRSVKSWLRDKLKNL